MLSFFQKIKVHYHARLPFVVYCKPNADKLIAVFQNDDKLYPIGDFTEDGFAFVSFDATKKYLIPADKSDVYVEQLGNDVFHYPKNSDLPFDAATKNTFEALVAKGIDAIQNNDFKKVVLSRKEIIAIQDFNFEAVIKQLQFNYPTAFNYCFYHPKIGLWIGATPEQLLRVNGTLIKTVALAGTQVFSENIGWQAKEQQEQQYVTDFIKSGLQRYCKSVVISEPYTQRAGAIAHIKSDITAELNSKNDLGNLINELHPTPAVCGLPKESSKQFILNSEGYNRSFYTGFLGELNIDFSTFKKGNSDLFVNLRCMEMLISEGNQVKNAAIYV